MNTTTENRLTAQDILTAGKATFTLSRGEYSRTFRIEKVEGENGRPDIFFAKLLTGADNDTSYTYIGVYEPQNGWLRLSAKSPYPAESQIVRAFRWVVGLIFNGRECEIQDKGFRLQWSDRCQRCGRTLTVSSSIDNRLGPECAKLVLGGN